MASLQGCLMLINDTRWPGARRFGFVSEAIVEPVIFSVGILTNILSLWVLIGLHMNKVFRVCLVSLTISDLLATVFGLAQILVEVLFYCGQVPEGHYLKPVIANNALYMTYLTMISISASLVVFIAFIRNMMYLKPLKSRVFFTPTVTKRACGAICVVTIIIYAPNCLQELWLVCYKDVISGTSPFCARVYEHIPDLEKIANTYLFVTVTLYGPVMLLAYVVNFVCIRVALSRSARNLDKVTETGQQTDNRRHVTNVRITKMLSLILLFDAICTLPAIVQGFCLVFSPKEGVIGKGTLFFEVLDTLAEIFLALRPAYNFWLYVFQRPEFRRRLIGMARSLAARCRCQCPTPYGGEFNSDDSKTSASTVNTLTGSMSVDTVSTSVDIPLEQTSKAAERPQS